VRQAERSLRVEQLAIENAQLRSLLDLRPSLTVRSQAAQVLYEASDPYSRKVVIDRGTTNGIVLASPVINASGVLGQVTRVFPLSSEVTLLIDKDAAIPVLNARNQARSAAFGSAATTGGVMEMRFMASNADVQVGDVLTTSGVDGVYPPGLPVAKVVSVDRKVDSGFARIVLAPAAPPDGARHVMVLEPVGVQMPARPASAPDDSKTAPAPKRGTGKARGTP
jgi:rod shape-determining protein MreC